MKRGAPGFVFPICVHLCHLWLLRLLRVLCSLLPSEFLSLPQSRYDHARSGADSSAARALALHARGPGFESPSAHLNWLDPVYAAVTLVTAPWWARKNRSGWAERFGR